LLATGTMLLCVIAEMLHNNTKKSMDPNENITGIIFGIE